MFVMMMKQQQNRHPLLKILIIKNKGEGGGN